MLHLRVIGQDGQIKFEAAGYTVDTVYEGEYVEGDKISVSMSEGAFIGVQLDPTLKESVVCVPGKRFDYFIPFGALRKKGYHA